MSLIQPGRYVRGVTSLDLDALWASGKRGIFIDRDNTIVPRDTHVLPDDVRAWLASARKRGFRLCIVSNNWAKNVRGNAQDIGAELVACALKTLPFAIWHALRKVGVRRREAVFIGDQLFTDALGANIAGVDSILVVPQANVDLKHGLAFRGLERRVLADRKPEGE